MPSPIICGRYMAPATCGLADTNIACVSQVSASAACMTACDAKPVVNTTVPAYSLSKYGGSCAHGGLAVEAARTHDNQCGCCDPGYLFSGGICYGARTVRLSATPLLCSLVSRSESRERNAIDRKLTLHHGHAVRRSIRWSVCARQARCAGHTPQVRPLWHV